MSKSEITPREIETLITKRAQARADNQYMLAKRIRSELIQHKIILEDKVGGTNWRCEDD